MQMRSSLIKHFYLIKSSPVFGKRLLQTPTLLKHNQTLSAIDKDIVNGFRQFGHLDAELDPLGLSLPKRYFE